MHGQAFTIVNTKHMVPDITADSKFRFKTRETTRENEQICQVSAISGDRVGNISMSPSRCFLVQEQVFNVFHRSTVKHFLGGNEGARKRSTLIFSKQGRRLKYIKIFRNFWKTASARPYPVWSSLSRAFFSIYRPWQPSILRS